MSSLRSEFSVFLNSFIMILSRYIVICEQVSSRQTLHHPNIYIPRIRAISSGKMFVVNITDNMYCVFSTYYIDTQKSVLLFSTNSSRMQPVYLRLNVLNCTTYVHCAVCSVYALFVCLSDSIMAVLKCLQCGALVVA